MTEHCSVVWQNIFCNSLLFTWNEFKLTQTWVSVNKNKLTWNLLYRCNMTFILFNLKLSFCERDNKFSWSDTWKQEQVYLKFVILVTWHSFYFTWNQIVLVLNAFGKGHCNLAYVHLCTYAIVQLNTYIYQINLKYKIRLIWNLL